MAPGDGPLDFQVPPAAETQIYSDYFSDLFSFFRFVSSLWETLPLVGLDKEVQVEMVHAVLDVVPVGSDQLLVVVDLRLQRSNLTKKKKKKVNKARRKVGDQKEVDAVPFRRGG